MARPRTNVGRARRRVRPINGRRLAAPPLTPRTVEQLKFMGGGGGGKGGGGIGGVIDDVVDTVTDVAGDVVDAASDAASTAASAASSAASAAYTAAGGEAPSSGGGGSAPAPRPQPAPLVSLVSPNSPMSPQSMGTALGTRLGKLLTPGGIAQAVLGQEQPQPTAPKVDLPDLPEPRKLTRNPDQNPATATITSRPGKFVDPDPLGKKTPGDASMAEIVAAAEKGTLRIGPSGRITTAPERQAIRALKGAKRAARRAMGPLPGLGPEESRNARVVFRRGLAADATPKELLAAAMTGVVESGFHNYGFEEADLTDLDSLGWRQERTSIYGTGPEGPTNVRASADRFYDESISDTGGTRGRGMTPGELAQTIQGSAYPERYDENREAALDILRGWEEGAANPAVAQRLVSARRRARALGIPVKRAGVGGGGPAVKQLKGPYSGSRRFVSSLIGQPVWGDKETGHSVGGMHQPVGLEGNPDAYAQDISDPAGNPAEGEPGYTQETVDQIVQNLQERGAEIPSGFAMGENWEGNVDGYDVEFLTAPHGTGPHIHLGAEWTGEAPPPGTYSGEPSGSSGGGTYFGGSSIEGGVPAAGGEAGIGGIGTSRPAIGPLTQLASPLAAGPVLPSELLEGEGADAESAAATLLALLGEGTDPAAMLPRRPLL